MCCVRSEYYIKFNYFREKFEKNFLQENFPGHLILRFGDIHWPSRSPDLTPLDFFLWV